MKKFKRLKPDVYDIVEANLEQTYKLLEDDQSPFLALSTLAEIDDPFEDSAIDFQEINFRYDSNKPIEDDFENARELFKTLKITPQQATDKYFWSGLAFTIGHEYLKERWGLKSQKSIMYRWITYTNTRRGLYFNGLARLWWYYKITYDERIDDPELYTKMSFANIDIIQNLMYRNLSSSQKVRMAYLKFMYHFKTIDYNLSKKQLLRVIRELSLLGGSLIIDNLEEHEIYDFLMQINLE